MDNNDLLELLKELPQIADAISPMVETYKPLLRSVGNTALDLLEEYVGNERHYTLDATHKWNQYQAYIKAKQKPSPLLKNTALAFTVGGLICVLGQLITDGWLALGLEKEDASAAASVSLVFLSAVLTALGLYHRLARFAGAGTLVPITGFANAVVSPAVDFRAEGVITGTAVKMFTIAGPVIVFGTAASALYGLVLWLIQVL